ncbi:hypothetical protein M3Y97_00639600 [Aphelenchoides bicaudatus]|nr:hypothetical protein M3Y97_00639600 [Aphelenchoides bicaudatus]
MRMLFLEMLLNDANTRFLRICDACAYMIKNSIKKLQPTNLTADQVEKILMDGCKDYPGEGGQTICEVIAYEYDDNIYASLLAGQPSDPDTLCFMALVCIDRV